MPSIRHLLFIKSPKSNIYRAVTTADGISCWWTEQVKIDPIEGTVAEFNFGKRYQNKMFITRLDKNNYVEWECIDGDKEWIGTRIKFNFSTEGDWTILKFLHTDWRNESDFFASCNFQWGRYMVSLKNYCEKGKGNPFSDNDK